MQTYNKISRLTTYKANKDVKAQKQKNQLYQ